MIHQASFQTSRRTVYKVQEIIWLTANKFVNRSPEASLKVSLNLNWVIWVALTHFKEMAHLKKGSFCGQKLKILLITVRHMASCNLESLFQALKTTLSWVIWVTCK